MKKILFIVLCCICLCGCDNNSWKKDFQVSDIKINVTEGWSRDDTYITYSIKNISNYDCNAMTAIVEFQSGSLTVEETIYPSSLLFPLLKNSTVEFEDVIMNKNYEGYTASFKEINCYDKDTN